MPRMLSLWLDFGSNVPDGSGYSIVIIMIMLRSTIFCDSAKKSQEKENKTLKMAISQLNEVLSYYVVQKM